MERRTAISISLKAAITSGYIITGLSVILAIFMISDGMNYTRGAIQVVQLYTEAAGLIAIPLVITACIQGAFRFGVSLYNEWQSLNQSD